MPVLETTVGDSAALFQRVSLSTDFQIALKLYSVHPITGVALEHSHLWLTTIVYVSTTLT